MKIPKENLSNEYRRQREVKNINMKIVVQRLIRYFYSHIFSVVPLLLSYVVVMLRQIYHSTEIRLLNMSTLRGKPLHR